MTTRTKMGGGCLMVLVVFGLMGALIFQRQELKRAQRESGLLQEQLSRLAAQVEELVAEKGRLAKLIETPSTNSEQSSELLRLRGQAGRLQLQERETEQSRVAQMRVAQSRLASAEAELERMTKLHSEHLVSADQLSQAKFALELLRAEAQGDAAAAFQVRLRHAEEELERITKLHSEHLVSTEQLTQARFAAEVLRAEAKGDKAEVFRVRLRQAEEQLANATELRRQLLITESEYEEAARRVEELRGSRN